MSPEQGRRWDDSGQPALTVREMVLDHDKDIESLKAWRNELRGALGLVKVTLGVSIVSGLVAVLALADRLSGVLK